MRVTLVRSTVRTDTVFMRGLDLDERRLIISCPSDATAPAILAALASQLTEVERVELAAALTDGKERP